MRVFKNLETIAKELVEVRRLLEYQEEIGPMLEQVHLDLSALIAKHTEFIEAVRHFFAHEDERKIEELKKSAKKEEDLKPTKYDDRF